MPPKIVVRRSASHAENSWPVPESLQHGGDNVTASGCDDAREHRQPGHARRAALSRVVAPVELRNGPIEVRLAADRSSE